MSPFFQWALVASSCLVSAVVATPLSTNPDGVPRRSSPFTLAPVIASEHPHGTVNNSYIIMLKDGVTDQLKTNHLNFLQTLHRTDPLVSDFQGIQKVYEGIHGYAGHFSDSVIEQLRTLPEVDYIERDQIVRTQEFTIQKSATWGLARISHRPRLTFGTFTKYLYDDVAGEGVDVYVVDTGINIDHVEFEGRASWGKTVPQNDIDEDGNGHGSHCAGTIASRKYGVAKKANVIAIKVLGTNGSGTMSDVIDGVLWAAQQAAKKAAAADAEFAATGRTSHKGSVANMSLGGGKSQALDTAVNKAVLSGLHFAVAAGNDNRDACNYSPASAENAITVGASTLGDERAYFSNWGACVDVFAPGLNILSTYKGSRTATSTLSGTSMASPHTAGLLAYLLSIYPHASFDPTFDAEENLISLTNDKLLSKTTSIYALAHATLPQWIANFLPSPSLVEASIAPVPKRPTLTPLQLKKAVIALTTKNVLSGLPENTVNKLIFNNATSH
ncbi:serine-type endopeptidase [Coprinopsis cinerea okayama7|uniref:Serine-type endopeptidase n=1 Tax=Coprinopsis cinerea (strain Okayama-7 / 130 / ATCC MYA-4618 / FGSC 9003) TaxID=240176 RepID=A8N592_COPC7|nr:serine-type endopeptidase [Coprinopsis cinerea okayama7\|eukprot:XP_001830037.1 serine-type endopeptidase [Coprinopsis cinerea okayama7\